MLASEEVDNSSWFSSPIEKFKQLWGRLKHKISELKNLDWTLRAQRIRFERIIQHPEASNDKIIQAKQGLARNDTYQSNLAVILTKINKHLPDWMAAESQSAGASLSGIGYVPIVLGATALGALAYVTVKGLRLLKEVYTENEILDRLEQNLITTNQATLFIQKPESTNTSLVSVSGGAFSGIGLAVVLGAGIFLYMQGRK